MICSITARPVKCSKSPISLIPARRSPCYPVTMVTEMIEGSFMVITNDYELELIVRKTDLSPDAIMDQTGVLLTTLGAEGALVREKGNETHIPPAAVESAVDPTGAGDAFRSGMIKGLVQEKEVIEAAKMGTVCASFCVEKEGTQTHHFTQEAFDQRLKAFETA